MENNFGCILYYVVGQVALGTTKTVFIPIAMLMLFVFSVVLTTTLVFGRQAM